MSRPALSAARAFEIIDLMSNTPEQPFTLSQIVQGTGTNIASCHAILAVMVDRGYLVRHPVHKTYRLGAALIGIGEAVLGSTPLIASARAATREIAAELDVEAILTARAGSDIIGLAGAAKSPLARVGLHVGHRIALKPPIGFAFFAWAPEPDVAEWIARDPTRGEAGEHAYRAALALVRDRGFLVTFNSPGKTALRDAVATAPRSRGGVSRVDALITALDPAAYQPATIDPGEHYAIDIISAPIFDIHGFAAYSITLCGFDGALTGADILHFADRLLRQCHGVMRANNIQPPQRGEGDARFRR